MLLLFGSLLPQSPIPIAEILECGPMCVALCSLAPAQAGLSFLPRDPLWPPRSVWGPVPVVVGSPQHSLLPQGGAVLGPVAPQPPSPPQPGPEQPVAVPRVSCC